MPEAGDPPRAEICPGGNAGTGGSRAIDRWTSCGGCGVLGAGVDVDGAVDVGGRQGAVGTEGRRRVERNGSGGR